MKQLSHENCYKLLFHDVSLPSKQMLQLLLSEQLQIMLFHIGSLLSTIAVDGRSKKQQQQHQQVLLTQ